MGITPFVTVKNTLKRVYVLRDREQGKGWGSRSSVLRHLVRFLKGLDPDRTWKVTVNEHHDDKTLEQLGYFFSTVVKVWSDFTGYEDGKEMYEVLKDRWAPRIEYRDLGFDDSGKIVPGRDVRHRAKGLSEMNKREVSEFIDRCIRKANAMGLEVPPPRADSRWDEVI